MFEMIAFFCNYFNSLNIYLVLIFGFLLIKYYKKLRNDEINKEKEICIESIQRRYEECPQQYPNGWLPVYDSHDLENGEVKPIFALGRDLVIYRGTSGKVYVFDAYCPHLGANLGVGGTVVGDDIKCHFHGWKFNNQGHCNAIPGLEEKAIPKTRIKKWRCDDVNDIIYVWYHLDEKEPDWFIPELSLNESFLYRGKFSDEIYCHIQDIVENEADQAHLDTVHGTEMLVSKYLQNLIKIKLLMPSWKICDHPNTHCTKTEIEVHIKVGFLSLPPILMTTKLTGPANFALEINIDLFFKTKLFVITNIITLSQSKQLWINKFYSEPTIIGFLFGRVLLRLGSILVDPDIAIWNRKRFIRNPIFTQFDERIVKFRRWYKQFYSLN